MVDEQLHLIQADILQLQKSEENNNMASEEGRHLTYVDLMKIPFLRRRTLILCYSWYVCCMLYQYLLFVFLNVTRLIRKLNEFSRKYRLILRTFTDDDTG